VLEHTRSRRSQPGPSFLGSTARALPAALAVLSTYRTTDYLDLAPHNGFVARKYWLVVHGSQNVHQRLAYAHLSTE